MFLTAKQEIRQRHGHEQQQRRLDHRGEHSGLAYREDGADTAQDVADGEGGAQFPVTAAGLDRDTEKSAGDRNHHRAPRGRTNDSRNSRTSGVGHCRRPRWWHP